MKKGKTYVAIEDAANIFSAEIQESEEESESDESVEENDGEMYVSQHTEDINMSLEAKLSNKSFQYGMGFNGLMEKEMKEWTGN